MSHDEFFDTFSMERVTWLALALSALGGAIYLLALRSISGAVSLTAAGAVAIVNFRWLEEVLNRVLQPGSPRFSGSSLVRIAGRMLLFGGLLAALVWIPKIDPVAVVLGFSTLVVAVVVEGIFWARVGGG
jgi:hypothetical protein